MTVYTYIQTCNTGGGRVGGRGWWGDGGNQSISVLFYVCSQEGDLKSN